MSQMHILITCNTEEYGLNINCCPCRGTYIIWHKPEKAISSSIWSFLWINGRSTTCLKALSIKIQPIVVGASTMFPPNDLEAHKHNKDRSKTSQPDTAPLRLHMNTSRLHILSAYISASTHKRCLTHNFWGRRRILSGWGTPRDTIQDTEEWKGAGTKFIQEVGTFWCVRFKVDAHAQTPHTDDLCHIWKQLRSCLTWPACTTWTLPRFLCVCCRGGGDPDTVAVGKWCVISQREHDSARLK